MHGRMRLLASSIQILRYERNRFLQSVIVAFGRMRQRKRCRAECHGKFDGVMNKAFIIIAVAVAKTFQMLNAGFVNFVAVFVLTILAKRSSLSAIRNGFCFGRRLFTISLLKKKF